MTKQMILKKYWNTIFCIQDGYTGIVVEGGKTGLLEDADKDMRVTRSFNQMIYWNYDRVPGNTDTLQEALQWIEVVWVHTQHVPVSQLVML